MTPSHFQLSSPPWKSFQSPKTHFSIASASQPDQPSICAADSQPGRLISNPTEYAQALRRVHQDHYLERRCFF